RGYYYEGVSSVKSINAWALLPDGKVVNYKKKDIADVAAIGYAIATDGRYKEIDARGDMVAGAIFAYEVQEASDSVFAAFNWSFTGSSPRLRSRIEFDLP